MAGKKFPSHSGITCNSLVPSVRILKSFSSHVSNCDEARATSKVPYFYTHRRSLLPSKTFKGRSLSARRFALIKLTKLNLAASAFITYIHFGVILDVSLGRDLD